MSMKSNLEKRSGEGDVETRGVWFRNGGVAFNLGLQAPLCDIPVESCEATCFKSEENKLTYCAIHILSSKRVMSITYST